MTQPFLAFSNRVIPEPDKLAELLSGKQGPSGTTTPGQTGLGGLPGQPERRSLGAGGVGGLLSGGLGELVERFKQSGQADTVDSWVNTGPNQQIAPSQVEKAIGPDVLETLSKNKRVCRAKKSWPGYLVSFPEAVDKYTPQGRLPACSVSFTSGKLVCGLLFDPAI